MSEDILKALAQLFAILTKQDGGATLLEKAYVASAFRKRLNHDSATAYIEMFEQLVDEQPSHDASIVLVATSVKDSIVTLQVCKRINRFLTLKQKMIVIVELFELVKSDGRFTWQRKHILDTIAKAFNIDDSEYNMLQNFVLQDDISSGAQKKLVRMDALGKAIENDESIITPLPLNKDSISFIKIRSANLLFFKHYFSENLTLNSQVILPKFVGLLPQGFSVKHPNGTSFYYSDVDVLFRKEKLGARIHFQAIDLSYHFSKKEIGIQGINISESSGSLVAIMGSSGSGKTTLLSLFAGILTPGSGQVILNGINIHKGYKEVQGSIGYISQDDLLIEELTVYQNLYFNTKLCYPLYTEPELDLLVVTTLDHLGLLQVKDLHVGTVFDKKISGGQRKRLNIALELIREPSILFVDEPTSGLSSRDSENVIDLLKELSLKGKLVFVVIHQPSSDIFRVFDKLLLLDYGGYMIYYGNPIDSITYLKKYSKHVNSNSSLCESCGTVTPEQIFSIIEEKVVNEYGQQTETRKIAPEQWAAYYKKNASIFKVHENVNNIQISIKKPSRWAQWKIFATRDLLSKIRNKQYLIINLIEAPLLALALAFILRYNNNLTFSKYTFRFNENIPAYILMSIIVAIFMGLCVSAEEIIRDKKLLKREALLNLSRTSYLLSKLSILFVLSAIQTLLFVLIGNNILEIQGLHFEYWLILFSISCMANVIGLVISSSFNSVVTVYIIIPLLLIPQMILSGGLLSFDKINDSINSKDKVPMAAEALGSRWAFEALAVAQFKYNNYEKNFYDVEQVEAITNFNLAYTLPDLKAKLHNLHHHFTSKDSTERSRLGKDIQILVHELCKQRQVAPTINNEWLTSLKLEEINLRSIATMHEYLETLSNTYSDIFLHFQKRKEHMVAEFDATHIGGLSNYKDVFYNESISDLVRNAHTKFRLLEINGRLVPKIESIFFNPTPPDNLFDFRTHFFAPSKCFLGLTINTFYFNVLVIWGISIVTYLLLYFEILKVIVDKIGNINYIRSNH